MGDCVFGAILSKKTIRHGQALYLQNYGTSPRILGHSTLKSMLKGPAAPICSIPPIALRINLRAQGGGVPSMVTPLPLCPFAVVQSGRGPPHAPGRGSPGCHPVSLPSYACTTVPPTDVPP